MSVTKANNTFYETKKLVTEQRRNKFFRDDYLHTTIPGSQQYKYFILLYFFLYFLIYSCFPLLPFSIFFSIFPYKL